MTRPKKQDGYVWLSVELETVRRTLVFKGLINVWSMTLHFRADPDNIGLS